MNNIRWLILFLAFLIGILAALTGEPVANSHIQAMAATDLPWPLRAVGWLIALPGIIVMGAIIGVAAACFVAAKAWEERHV